MILIARKIPKIERNRIKTRDLHHPSQVAKMISLRISKTKENCTSPPLSIVVFIVAIVHGRRQRWFLCDTPKGKILAIIHLEGSVHNWKKVMKLVNIESERPINYRHSFLKLNPKSAEKPVLSSTKSIAYVCGCRMQSVFPELINIKLFTRYVT